MRINKMITMRKIVDLLSNSLNQVFKEMHRDQFGEFVCGYWGLRVNIERFHSRGQHLCKVMRTFTFT